MIIRIVLNMTSNGNFVDFVKADGSTFDPSDQDAAIQMMGRRVSFGNNRSSLTFPIAAETFSPLVGTMKRALKMRYPNAHFVTGSNRIKWVLGDGVDFES